MPSEALSPVLEWSINISTVFLLLALALAGVRILRGPDAPNRILALDLLAGISLSIVVLVSIQFNVSLYLDVAIVIVVVTYLGTVGLARYLETLHSKKK